MTLQGSGEIDFAHDAFREIRLVVSSLPPFPGLLGALSPVQFHGPVLLPAAWNYRRIAFVTSDKIPSHHHGIRPKSISHRYILGHDHTAVRYDRQVKSRLFIKCVAFLADFLYSGALPPADAY